MSIFCPDTFWVVWLYRIQHWKSFLSEFWRHCSIVFWIMVCSCKIQNHSKSLSVVTFLLLQNLTGFLHHCSEVSKWYTLVWFCFYPLGIHEPLVECLVRPFHLKCLPFAFCVTSHPPWPEVEFTPIGFNSTF